MGRIFAHLLVILLVVSAGCLGGGGPAPTATPTERPTTERATTTPGLDDVTLPDGVSREGVEASTLLATHRQALAETSFVQQFNESMVVGNESADRSAIHTRRVKASGKKVLLVATDSRGTTRRYSNGSATFAKLTTDGTTEYAAVSEPLTRTRVLGLGLVRPYLAGGAFAAAGTTVRDGETLIRLRATEVGNASAIRQAFQAAEIHGVEGTGLVDQRGRIRSLQVTIRFVPSGSNRTVTTRLRYSLSALGATTVSAPAWVSTARERATHVNVTKVTGPALKITPTRGTLEANTTIHAFLGNTTGSVRLSAPVPTGESVYLSVRNGRVRLTRSRPTGDLESISRYVILGTTEHGLRVFISRQD